MSKTLRETLNTGSNKSAASRQRQRRQLLVGSAVSIAWPALAAARRVLAPMTDGPFYPPRAWRERWPDQDADLTRTSGPASGVLTARGEHLGLDVTVLDTQGRPIDGATVEIWQCDVQAAYRHPDVALVPGRHDPGFQGWGAARSDRAGALRLRTIRPVPYPGRTPHIHVKLRHAAFGELTSQLFVAGDAGNERDGLWRRIATEDRPTLEMTLQPAPAESGLRWRVSQVLVVPA